MKSNKEADESRESTGNNGDLPGLTAASVDHPAHYTYGAIEVIDAIEGLDLPYHLGNAVKYIARAGRKDPAKTEEDLCKAIWYIKRYIAYLEKQKKGAGDVD